MSRENGTVEKAERVFWTQGKLVVGIVGTTAAVLISMFGYVLKIQNEINTLKISMQSNEKISESIANLRDNHIHTIDQKLDGQEVRLRQIEQMVTEIRTILRENR